MSQSPLEELGSKNSLLPSRFVGFMRGSALAAASFAALATAGLSYAHWESKRPVLRKETIYLTPRPGFHALNVLHISDLHMFPGQDFIKPFLAKVAEENTIDIVISTGDNLGAPGASHLLLSALEPLLALPGAFVFGSNDYYSPLSKSPLDYLKRNRHVSATQRGERTTPDLPWFEVAQAFTRAGWKDLSNRCDAMEVTGTQLALAGVDDPHINRDRFPDVGSTWKNPGALRIGLTHAPYRRVLDRFSALNTDVILAGHTHGGQVRVPFVGPVVVNCDIPLSAGRGLTPWNNSRLHVSAGLGTSPFAQIRFSCRPEVSLLKLVPAA